MLIAKITMEHTPPETGAEVYKKVSEITGNHDPYKAVKEKNIALATRLSAGFKEKVAKSDDRLLTAVRLAVAGNVIDYGVEKTFNIKEDAEKILRRKFSIFDYKEFRRELKKAKKILYIGDNCGEAVFDKILIEEMGKPTVFAVREIPVINDITKTEAVKIGIDKVAEIVSSGSTAPGTILKLCDKRFVEKFNAADMIISKGQGNYEGLSESRKTVFFLLKAKCPVIADSAGVNEGDIILKGINI